MAQSTPQGSQGSQGSQSATTIHIRVPKKDAVTQAFLDAQDNKSTSVRMLIRLFVNTFGTVDVVEAMAQMVGSQQQYTLTGAVNTPQPGDVRLGTPTGVAATQTGGTQQVHAGAGDAGANATTEGDGAVDTGAVDTSATDEDAASENNSADSADPFSQYRSNLGDTILDDA